MKAESGNCYTESKVGMNTFLRMTSYAGNCPEAFAAAWNTFQRIERLCSRFEQTSQLSQINQMAGKARVPVAAEVLEILLAAQNVANFTDGAFDATIGAVTELWAIGGPESKLPAVSERKKVAALVDYRLLDINGEGVFLPQSGMKLDLGGIAKEFAVHEAAKAASAQGFLAGIIDAGGDICTIGAKSDQEAWRIGIQHPRQQNALLASVSLQNWDTVETSGDYRRYLQNQDFFHSHIFDPRADVGTGELISVTLIYKRKEQLLPINGTACMAGGLAASRRFLGQLPEVEAILVTNTLQVFVTEGLEDYIHVLPQDMKQQTVVLKRKVFQG
ncbi:FAD:protein FMN transferase [Propionispora vibrioides]|uniref:FAD:protein FMN transferase n=1 Tax=Propionispora vibrioides TaxID=112903 RepID=A0A1H8Q166_9FIRM|nr:FAD:protein FMN transferase [Propionispora vibrioides]SEO47728.1 thiamine biosynthesis lipoprotein [Propionispora vibrioides]